MDIAIFVNSNSSGTSTIILLSYSLLLFIGLFSGDTGDFSQHIKTKNNRNKIIKKE